MQRSMPLLIAVTVCALASDGPNQARQPIVQPGPSEPDLLVLLDRRYGLDMLSDLSNPLMTTPADVPGRFRKAGPGPVAYTPEIALGLEVAIHGGYYLQGQETELHETWTYEYKNTSKDLEDDVHLPPALRPGSKVEFDPGDELFAFYVGNDQFRDTVYTEPLRVARRNPRLASQPYKAMIYPYRDPATKRLVSSSYLICWEYSTNDDFQDVVCRVDNVILVGEGKRQPSE